MKRKWRWADVILAGSIIAALVPAATLVRPRPDRSGAQAEAANLPASVQGVSPDEIQIGSCIALSGALSERGKNITDGANDYLAYINEKGGVNGRKIALKTCDDGYDPTKAITCFNTCLKDKVFAGAFFAGSAPSSKYVRMADVTRVPMMGFCTGVPLLYEPHPTVFVLRCGYKDEVEQIVEQAVKHGIKRFGIIYQEDAFGAAVRENAVRFLAAHGITPVAEASYPRATKAVDAAVAQVKGSGAQAVILGAMSGALTEIVKKRNQEHWPVAFFTVSVADDYLADLGKASDGIVVTQVVPPLDEKTPALSLFEELWRKHAGQGRMNMDSYEAFLNAIVLAEGLKLAGKDITQTKFVKALESMHDFDIGAGQNFKVTFGANDHAGFGIDSVYSTVMDGGKFRRLTEKDWSSLLHAGL